MLKKKRIGQRSVNTHTAVMDLAMEEKPAVIFGGSSSSLTTADDDISWDAWSPDLDCSNEYLNSLIFSSTKKSEHAPAAGTPFPVVVVQKCSFDSKMTPPAITAAENKGERLLHLLMAAAEALSGDDQSAQDLARVILVRLNELLTGASSGIERLAAHFTHGLHTLLEHDTCPFSQSPAGELLMACHMLHDMSPFASFGHLTANQAILEAFAGERRVHVIDYDIAEGVQWASLIQAMASLRPPPHLKITALSNASYRSASVAQEAGRRLSAFAETMGQPFSFRMCRLDQRKKFQPAAVKIVRGEPVVVNCVLNGNGSASPSALSFLAGAAALGARLVTVVEQEGGGNGKGNFFGRFMNELERYMAVWESLEAGFPKQGRVRRMVERVLLGPRIAEALQTAYGRSNGLEEASIEGCGQWMAVAGFEEVGLSFFNRSQARLLLGLFNDGYRVQEVASNKIALCWKSCQLLSASVWAIPTPSSSSPPPFDSIYL